MYQNLRKASQFWGVISKVLTKTEGVVWNRGMLYKAVEQMVLLYGISSWLVMGEMLTLLEGFHNRAARMITGTKNRHTENG